MAFMRSRFFILIAAFFASLVALADSPLKVSSDSVYYRYIRHDIEAWRPVIDSLHDAKPKKSVETLDFLLSLEYGYVAWCVSDTACAQPEKALDDAIADLESFQEAIKSVPDKTLTRRMLESKARSYYSAFLAYQMKLNTVRAIINGWRCVNNAKNAVTMSPDCWFSQLEYGNVMHYMPMFLGGSKINARKAYISAIKIMDDSGENDKNWLYLHALLCLADCYKQEKDFSNVQSCYDRILAVEPDFALVRDSLAPSLARKK